MLTRDDAHVYRYDGRIVPSVTQVLRDAGLIDFSGVPADVLEAARWRGTLVHKATEFYDRGVLDEADLDERLVGYVQAWKRFRSDTGFVPATIEQFVYHPAYGYAGQLDRDGFMKGKAILLDVKTGIAHPAAGPQTAAYKEAHCGASPRERFSVHLHGDGKYHLECHTNRSDFAVFAAALTLTNWKRRHA
jgi:hypothetical protein